MRVVGLAGWSGAGKTTLVAKLIPELRSRGLRVSTIKHAHHGFDLDRPGKDSHTHRLAGATEVLISSSQRWALMHELRGHPEPDLRALLAKLSRVDLVLVEGFKRCPIPKIEIHRSDLGKPMLAPDDPHIRAIATDLDTLPTPVRLLHLNDVAAIADALIAIAIPVHELEPESVS